MDSLQSGSRDMRDQTVNVQYHGCRCSFLQSYMGPREWYKQNPPPRNLNLVGSPDHGRNGGTTCKEASLQLIISVTGGTISVTISLPSELTSTSSDVHVNDLGRYRIRLLIAPRNDCGSTWQRKVETFGFTISHHHAYRPSFSN